MSNMGARVARMFRNFNLENRVYREISKEKPTAAPRHAGSAPAAPAGSSGGPAAGTEDAVTQKNDPLLTLLKSVYVESTDPAAAETSKEKMASEESERRPLKFSLPGDPYGLVEITDVPKGKLTIAEALKVMSGHHQQPQMMTPEKIAQDYCLDLKDTKALLEFFIPFQVEIIPPKTGDTKQLKAS